jgi:hypothetical protein
MAKPTDSPFWKGLMKFGGIFVKSVFPHRQWAEILALGGHLVM